MNTAPHHQDNLLQLLTCAGVLLHVSVRYPRFHKRLAAADLGLRPDQVDGRLMSLGHKRLLPRDALSRLALVESRAHALVEGSTFPFLGGLARFLPNGKLQEVQAGLAALQAEFQGAGEDFLAHYRQHRDGAIQEWQQLAGRIGGGQDQQERLVAQIGASFPLPDTVRRRMGFDVHLFQIALPEGASLDLASFGSQAELARARGEAAEAARREIRQGVEGFIADCVTSLRGQTAQLCEEMLQSMRDGKTGGVHQRTLNRLSRFIEEFRQLNFAGDQEMARQLDLARDALLQRSAADYRADPAAARDLESGLAQLRDHARHLATRDATELVESFGQLGRRRLQMAS